MVDFLEGFCYNSFNFGQYAHELRTAVHAAAETSQGGKS